MADVRHTRKACTGRTSSRDNPRDARITLRLTSRQHATLVEAAGGKDISTYVRQRLAGVDPRLTSRTVSDCREALLILDSAFDLLVSLDEHLARDGRVSDEMVLIALQQTHDRLDEVRLALVKRVMEP